MKNPIHSNIIKVNFKTKDKSNMNTKTTADDKELQTVSYRIEHQVMYPEFNDENDVKDFFIALFSEHLSSEEVTQMKTEDVDAVTYRSSDCENHTAFCSATIQAPLFIVRKLVEAIARSYDKEFTAEDEILFRAKASALTETEEFLYNEVKRAHQELETVESHLEMLFDQLDTRYRREKWKSSLI